MLSTLNNAASSLDTRSTHAFVWDLEKSPEMAQEMAQEISVPTLLLLPPIFPQKIFLVPLFLSPVTSPSLFLLCEEPPRRAECHELLWRAARERQERAGESLFMCQFTAAQTPCGSCSKASLPHPCASCVSPRHTCVQRCVCVCV